MKVTKMHQWAVAITRESGAEELAFFDPLLADSREAQEQSLRQMQQLNTELEGKLRVVRVAVEIREIEGKDDHEGPS